MDNSSRSPLLPKSLYQTAPMEAQLDASVERFRMLFDRFEALVARLENALSRFASASIGSAPPAVSHTLSSAQFSTLDRLRQACEERAIIISADGRITEQDAARLLNRSSNTLRNWRATDGRLRFIKFGGRIYYRLEDIAFFLDDEKFDL